MHTIVFDIGGVLRKQADRGLKRQEETRHYDAIRALYCLCVGSSNWRVFVAVWLPTKDANVNVVKAELARLKLPPPDGIRITSSIDSKRSIYAELKPDIVVDDELSCIDAAVQEGAATLRVR